MPQNTFLSSLKTKPNPPSDFLSNFDAEPYIEQWDLPGWYYDQMKVLLKEQLQSTAMTMDTIIIEILSSRP